ncbi:helix-turn-helix domain-containing protein [Hymenobacter sp. BT491]|uniref:helix-turn-helix domain-containing protein n=1 Tax=Hymenobacter sp. BT491 TaxID=2766779 RepID=UPI00165365D8|nr:helix-turn-helix transcriptional regulator [Hymenobacter sp. BT491]MBC6988994.1 helix-turn-helix transcriptional regulator [Hymenobacter sp. BT491]
METTPGKRVRMFRESLGYKTASAFAEAAGLKIATLSSIETDRTAPSFDILATLVAAFPQVNSDWLLTGNGPMLREGKAPQASAPGPRLSADPQEVADLKKQREDWRNEALTWKSLYLSSIGKADLPGKSQDSSNAAAELARREAGFQQGGRKAAQAAPPEQVKVYGEVRMVTDNVLSLTAPDGNSFTVPVGSVTVLYQEQEAA